MTHLTVISTVPIRPQRVEAVRPALAGSAASTRAAEGCLAFDLYESATTPGVFVTVARWVDSERFQAHQRSPEVSAALAAAEPTLAGAPAIHPLVPVDVVS